MKKPNILTVGIASLLTLPTALTAADRDWIGAPGTTNWNDTANWSGGNVPTTGTGDNIYIHTTGSITGVAIDANQLILGVGTVGAPASGFTFGAGTYNINYIGVGENRNGNAHPVNLVNGYARAFINAGTTINAGNFFVGEWDGATADVIQGGGDVNISNQFRVGHWPQAGGGASRYTLNAGTVTVAGNPADPFNEGQAGNVYLGIDSTGVLTVNGGTFTAKGIALDNRGATAGEDTLAINGGVVNIGANGIVSQNSAAPSTYNINLGGGTLRATASWSSNLETTLISGGSGIQYDTNGNNITLSGVVNGAGGFTKIGAGTLILSGTNSYSGTTRVNAGTVTIGGGSSLGAGALNVAAGTLNLAGKGVVTSVHSVSSITLAGGAITFGVNAAASDRLSSAGTISLTGVNSVNLAGLGSITPGSTYTLLSGTGFSGAGSLVLGSTPAGFFTWTPTQTATAYQVSVSGAAVPLVAYWAGSVSPVWSDSSVAPVSNWRTSAAGTTDTNQLPGAVTDVFFTANGAGNLTNTLGADFSIKSLTVSSATTGAVTIGGANTLTVGSGGITRQAGAGSLTINTSGLTLGAGQTWANNDATNPVTVNAALGGSGALATAGGGLIVLAGNNTAYTGNVTVGTGTVRLANANAAGAASGNLAVNGTLDLNGSSASKNDLSGGSSGVITSGVAGAVSAVFNSGTYAGSIASGSGTVALVKNGGGTLTLTGANTYTGGTTINGTLQIGNGGATGSIGSGPTTLNGNLVFATSNPNTINGSVNAGGPAGTLILVANSAVTLAPGTDVKVNSLLGGINGQNDTLGGTLNIGPGTSLLVQSSFTIGNTNGGGAESHSIFNQTGGVVDVNAPNTDGRNFVLGHWNQGRGTYNLSAGTLNSPTISMSISWDGNGTFNLSGTGVANMRGLRFGHNGGRTGVFNLTGGTLNLGAEGIWEQNTNFPNDINLGGGIVRAAVNTNIYLPAELTGTNGNVTFDTNGNTLAISRPLSGSGGLTKIGNGTLTLSAVNTHTGATVVSGGTLLLDTAGDAPGSDFTVQNGGTFQIAGTGKTLASLTIEGGSIFNLPAVTATTNTLTNALTFSGVPSFTVRPLLGGPVTAGQTFDLFTAASVVGSAGTITTDFGPSHVSGHTAISGTTLVLTIDTSSGVLTWNNGAGTGNWVTNADANFIGADGKFLANDFVTFGNTAAGTVTLVGSLAPTAVTVNSSADYTFTGAGSITAGSLTKTGSSTLTLATINSYSGGTTVNGGVLNLTGQNGGDGAIRGTVTVNAGGELRATGATGAIFGYNTGAKLDTLNIVGGLVNSVGGDNHIWNAAVNMTGGELRVNGGVSSAAGAAYQWSNSALNTFASSDTALISGRLNLRADNSNRFIATVEDGAATTDLLVTAAITHTGVGIYKLGPGNMELTGGAATNTIRAVGGELTISGSGTYSTGSIAIGENQTLSGVAGTGEGTLNIRDNVSITTGTMTMGENFGGAFQTNTVNQTGGSVTTTGNSGENAGFRLGHWPNEVSTYNLSAGSLSMNDPNGGLAIATDGTGIFNQTGGTLIVPQIIVNHRNGGGSATFTLEGGEANIGAGGIVTAGGPAAVNLGGGIVRATAANVPISVALTLTGTNGDVSFDTNGNTITVTGALNGGGGFTKDGVGRMVLNATNSATGIFTVNAGTLSLLGDYANDRIPSGGIVQINNGGTLEFSSVNVASNGANYIVGAGGTLTNAAGVVHMHVGSVQLNGGTWTTDAASGSYNGENYQIDGGTVSVGGSSPSLITKQGGSAADRGISWMGLVTFDVADVTGNSTADLIVSTELENADSGVADLVKTGTGTMRLAFANSYTGSTTVAAGTLEFAVGETLSSLIIADGATAVVGTSGPPPAQAFGDAPLAAIGAANQAVPEPGSAALLFGGMLAILGIRRRG